MVLDEKSFTAEQFLEYTGEVFILESEWTEENYLMSIGK
jgi:hypothetical protein